ncbi:MAG: HlyC/CorC family transporter [Bacteroidetes bacterium]|nr:HlyC/CorC family transporter [Bacteroidota bacterium]
MDIVSNCLYLQAITTSSMDSDILVILITLILSAFFSGIEIAFISSNKLRIELQNKQGVWTARILAWYMKDPSRFISTTLIGNNIALVVYGIYSGKILDEMLILSIQDVFWRFVLITIVSTLVVLITAEFLPKALFRLNPDTVLNALILPFHINYFLLWPVVTFITFISKGIIRLLTGEKQVASKPVFSRVDLDHLISQTGQIELNDETNLSTEMFKNALDFGTLKVRDCMVPRTEIIAVDENANIEELYKVFLDSRHSKIPVYKDSIDNIVGYAHQVHMFKKPSAVKEATMPILITNESRSLHDQLKEMTQKSKSMAVVVDEFGGTAGIITIEDIIEEIFGEIDDEYDTEDLIEQKLGDNHFVLSGRHTIEYLNETYNLNIPVGDYETLNGFIIDIHGNIPEEKEVILVDRFELSIRSVKQARIEEVELRITNKINE